MASPEVVCKDPRYKQFSDSVERSLKLFEDALEWQDIITCLTKLHKVRVLVGFGIGVLCNLILLAYMATFQGKVIAGNFEPTLLLS